MIPIIHIPLFKEATESMRFSKTAGRLAAAIIGLCVHAPETLSAGEFEFAQSKQVEGKGKQPSILKQPTAPKRIESFLHPLRKFTLEIPKGADVKEKDPSQLSIRSRKGFMINVQTGDANPSLSFRHMAGKLEAKYLGAGKPWVRKIQEKPVIVAGLQGHEFQYQGAGSIIKVVFARGVKTDFVFMFFAPQEKFLKLEPEFRWLLLNFRPSPADLPAMAASRSTAKKKPGKGTLKSKRFAEPGYGYTIQYPGDWEASKPTPTSATFSGQQGTDAFQVVVSIQNVQPPTAKTPAEAVATALADLKASLSKEASEISIIGEKPLTYKNGQISLIGTQMVVLYTFAGERFRKWTLVLPRPSGTVAHIWSYTAPEKGFKTFRPLVDAMLKSWTIKPEAG